MFNSVHNYYEQLVFAQIVLCMQENHEPLNIDLMEDIACIALNHLPSRYVRHDVDTAFNLNDAEREIMNIEVALAVNDAMIFLKRRHEPH